MSDAQNDTSRAFIEATSSAKGQTTSEDLTPTATDAQALKGCVSYQGPAKTIEEMDKHIALSVAQDFFAQLAPADTSLSEELIRERRKEADENS